MSLAALLMGVANRAGEVNRMKEQRQYNETLAGKQAQMNFLIDRISDPSLPDEDRQHYTESFEKLTGAPKGIVDFGKKMVPTFHQLIKREAPGMTQEQMPSAPAQPPSPTGEPQNVQPPLGSLPRPTPTLGTPPPPPPAMQAPDTELGRRQIQQNKLLEQSLAALDRLNLPPELKNLVAAQRAGLPSSVQAAGVATAGRLKQEEIKGQYGLAKAALGAGNQGQFVSYQAPGGAPRTLFQVTKGPSAGKLFEGGQETQLSTGETKVYEHPDKVETLIQDGNVVFHNVTKELGSEKSVNVGPGQKIGAQGADLTPEGVDIAAELFAKTGQMPAMGVGAANIRAQIINRAAQLYPKVNLASNRAEYTSNQASLTQMQKNRDAVVTWESTARKNLELFQKTAKSVIDSGSPLINLPLRIAAQRAAGSAQVAAFNAARTVALNEIAKVLNNPNLTGQLTNEARAEVEGLSPATATLAQVNSVVDILKRDMKNRHDELDSTIEAIKNRIGGRETAAAPAGEKAQGKKLPAPPIGTVVDAPDGKYRLKAYPVSDKNNWEKVQ